LPSNKPSPFIGNLLDWPVNRRDRTFEVYVAEPGVYDPPSHAEIFTAAINVFVGQEPALIDPYETGQKISTPLRFDLITFPEAFLPTGELITTLRFFSQLESPGCVHVGLRPHSKDPNHLLPKPELSTLLDDLNQVPGIVERDLDKFSQWLANQQDHMRFNVGCLFTVDANRQLRVCLHPKLVPSSVEVSSLEEQHMSAGNLLTVVRLRPTDKLRKTIVIQPLLCSDALHLDTDSGEDRPLEAVNKDAGCFGDDPPDHIDIVSVATHTRQIEQSISKGSFYRTWHQEFKNSFVRAASDDALARHHFSTFVLSNFRTLSTNEPGGLSGAFIPVPRGTGNFREYVSISSWGRLQGSKGDNMWSSPDQDHQVAANWETRGYIASLNPFGEKADAVARLFGFTVARLPRDRSLWRGSSAALTKCTLQWGESRGSPPLLAFVS